MDLSASSLEAPGLRLDPDSNDPLYVQVKRAIEADITARKLRHGTRLASERRLSEEFSISRVTARRALRALAEDGLIQSADGRGWDVVQRVDEPGSVLQSFSQMARAKGFVPGARVLTQIQRAATLDEAEALEIVPGAMVLDLRRLRLLDQVPVALERNRIPVAMAPTLIDVDFANVSLYDVLREECGLVPTVADLSLEAGPADADAVRELDLAHGAPVLLSRSLTYVDGGRPLDLSSSCFRGDRYRFRTSLRGTGA